MTADIAALIKAGLELKSVFYDLIKAGATLARRFHEVKREFASPRELADAFFKGDINYGDVVKCRAFISRYGQTYKPVTYMPTIAGPATERITGHKIVHGKLQTEVQLETKFQAYQLPVEILPPVELDGRSKANCCYMYDPGFFGFNFHSDPGKERLLKEKGKVADTLMLPMEARPIPIVMPVNKFHKFTEMEVIVKGVIQQMPTSLGSRLIELYDASGRELFSLCSRPDIPDRSLLCLSLMDEHADITKIEPNAERRVDGSMFMEMHLSYKSPAKLSEGDITMYLPNSLGIKGMGYASYPGHTTYLTRGNIRVVGLGGQAFSIFTDVCLNDVADYKKKFEGLRNYYSVLCHNITQTAKKKGVDIEICPDFVFDYSKRQLFNSGNILNSSEVKSVAVGPVIRQTISWLNGA